jgi:hypothetical protein
VVPTSLPELFPAGGMTQDEFGELSGNYGPINPVAEEVLGIYAGEHGEVL